MERTVVEWSGPAVVGGGISTFYTDPGDGAPILSALVTFFTAIKAMLPSGITWQIPDGGDLINPANGQLTGTWSESGGGVLVNSSGAGSYASGVGGRIIWRTGAVRGGRRVRGSTFVCPLVVSQFEGSGMLTSAAVTSLENAAQTLLGSATGLVVWSRPRVGLPGEMVPIASASVPDKVSWLRTRRT